MSSISSSVFTAELSGFNCSPPPPIKRKRTLGNDEGDTPKSTKSRSIRSQNIKGPVIRALNFSDAPNPPPPLELGFPASEPEQRENKPLFLPKTARITNYVKHNHRQKKMMNGSTPSISCARLILTTFNQNTVSDHKSEPKSQPSLIELQGTNPPFQSNLYAITKNIPRSSTHPSVIISPTSSLPSHPIGPSFHLPGDQTPSLKQKLISKVSNSTNSRDKVLSDITASFSKQTI